MFIITIAAALLGFSFTVHVVVWRLARPVNSAVALFTTFVFCGLVGAFFFDLILVRLNISSWRLTSTEWGQLLILYCAAMAGYINTYPAVEGDSPTLFLAILLDRAGASGVAMKEIRADWTDDILILPGLDSLVRERMAVLENGCYRLTAKGLLIARVFKAYRRLTGRGMGG